MLDLELIKSLAVETAPVMLRGLANLILRLASPAPSREPGGAWWQRPGIGIMYQIEFRPGMDWDRDFDEFNISMKGADGRLDFDGPLCRVDEWIRLSERACADYHIMEIKWHDGICYFDTALTDWKTDVDYAGEFAERSRDSGIPFMYYYSSIFDHNPMFDAVQPRRDRTISFIGMPGIQEYDRYIRGQYAEIADRYGPDGMWIDWYWHDQATKTTIEYFRNEHPGTVLAFNASNLFYDSYSKLDYTSGEAHDLDGFYLKIRRTHRGILTVFESAWKWAALNRKVLSKPWELITPAGKWWQDPTLRRDPEDLLRMAAVVMASGGKLCLGATARMDGSIFPDQVTQLEALGEWYRPRRSLFADYTPARYRGRRPPGIRVSPARIRAVACRRKGEVLLHLINMEGSAGPISLRLDRRRWGEPRTAVLEPGGCPLEPSEIGHWSEISIDVENVDRVDTILSLTY